MIRVIRSANNERVILTDQAINMSDIDRIRVHESGVMLSGTKELFVEHDIPVNTPVLFWAEGNQRPPKRLKW